MIDSVLKGTGNSRFLKSAVPAGTSWADALAMLQAGTFPIDFNGINAEGFQQVGTPLNKANLLKDATAAQIGLPPSTTPDGMFRALGNTGELHVWRKTVKNAADVPAGYNLGVKTTKTIVNTKDNSSGRSTIYYSSSVSVSDSGKVSLKNPTSIGVDIYTSSLPIVGKFFYINLSIVQTSDLIQKKIYFVPSDTDISVDDSPTAFSGVVQEVTGYAKIPAGTTTTYPVSTNPNAYQEGDDAKAAGYTLGDAVAMKLMYNGVGSGHYVAFNVSDSVSVTDSGEVSLVEKTSVAELTPNNTAQFSNMKGKFFANRGRYQASTEIVDGVIYFIPDNATVSVSGDSGGSIITCDKVQPVTGYAAIPAGTTIEYLGRLGDKARVQMLSYVGTGTYGSSNPNSLTFDFVPKLVIISSAPVTNSYVYIAIMVPDAGIYSVVMSTVFEYESRTPGGSGTVTKNNKTITFYSGDNIVQLNGSGTKYYAVAIG